MARGTLISNRQGVLLSDRAGGGDGNLGQLGCQQDQWGHLRELSTHSTGLSGCPSSGATVIVEDNPIPQWVWIIAAVWAGLMLVKKR
jgi:hypothetical protein